MLDPLVLIPGAMCDGRLFSPQIAEFSAERPVMIVPPIGAAKISDLALRLLDFAPPAFALAGLSMGGIVAMEVIRQAPDRVRRVALMDTNPFPEPAEKAALRDAQIENVVNGGLRKVMREEIMPNYLADGSAKGPLLNLCLAMAEDLGPEVFAEQFRAVQSRPDQSASLRGIAVPTLVLCGQEDRLCPVDRHEFMHDAIPGSMLIIVPGAGHLPTLEQPARTNEALGEWLRA
ncbi:MAG: alpha/beta fold hydrolase [Boseongicola sp. SB0662_bin_57]|nr:alpha/beta fold hydrolase [Boseongicola sp. SB0662_bin_57]